MSRTANGRMSLTRTGMSMGGVHYANEPLEPGLQAGAIPFRFRPDGTVQVLLVTSRAGNWIVPKGRIEPGQTPRDAAKAEAFEEAGVIGMPEARSVGHYEYTKMGKVWRVELYPMRVHRVLTQWPEQDYRERAWVSVDEAIRRVAYPDLRDALEKLELMDRHTGAA